MRQAVALQPSNAAYQNNLGAAMRRAGRLADAESLFRRLVQSNPDDPHFLSNLALTVAEQGRAEEGVGLCHQCLP